MGREGVSHLRHAPNPVIGLALIVRLGDDAEDLQPEPAQLGESGSGGGYQGQHENCFFHCRIPFLVTWEFTRFQSVCNTNDEFCAEKTRPGSPLAPNLRTVVTYRQADPEAAAAHIRTRPGCGTRCGSHRARDRS